jgi:hypothetical protein
VLIFSAFSPPSRREHLGGVVERFLRKSPPSQQIAPPSQQIAPPSRQFGAFEQQKAPSTRHFGTFTELFGAIEKQIAPLLLQFAAISQQNLLIIRGLRFWDGRCRPPPAAGEVAKRVEQTFERMPSASHG